MIQSFIEATSILLRNGKFTNLTGRKTSMHFKYAKYNHVKHSNVHSQLNSLNQ